MFWEERIKSIKPIYRVLEVGPGGTPHPRSDVFLERRFNSYEQTLLQRGLAPELRSTKPIYFYDGGRFPFKDKEFDYVICSHVIEHVPASEIHEFIAELVRVAGKGYVEFPSALYELINNQDVHLWYMRVKNDSIIALRKENTIYPSVALVMRAIFYANNKIFNSVFNAYRDIFFHGFEWSGEIKLVEVNNWQDLYSEIELIEMAQKIEINGSEIKEKNLQLNEKFNLGKLVNLFVRLLGKTKKYFIHNHIKVVKPKIDPTALLEDKALIKLNDGVEIKAGVIISTHHNYVEIGINSQINPYTVIYGGSGVKIGDNVMIAPHCVIAAGNHDYLQLEVPMRFAGTLTQGPILIGDDVWIGANCTIADSVKIGVGAVVAANSLVNKDVLPYEIVGGVPAKKIANRKEKK